MRVYIGRVLQVIVIDSSVTKNGVTKQLDKRKVLFKTPNTSNYIEITADDTNIYYPAGVNSNIYTGYAEVTSYINQSDFLGEYFVADLAIMEGVLAPQGYHGGWGMVIVYENNKMNWRDITVFDGHAYVTGTTADFTFGVNGFNTAQNGDINLKLGVMAAEGDVDIPGDYFEIERLNSNTFQRLSHSTNTTNNFFNSSINTGGNSKNPNLQNNTGVDIAMFDINNTNNAIIANSQTATRFRYGTTSDRFVIFNVTFSVDAYVPEPIGVLTNTSIDGNPPGPTNTTLEPDENADYAIEIRNNGTEAINNTVITVPIPNTINPSNLNINYNIYPPLNATTNPNIPVYDPNIGSNGSIVWNLGKLPVPSNPDIVLADLSFSLTVTTSCAILGDPNFDPNVAVNGSISGVGAISNISFNKALIQGYQTNGLCIGEPIPTPSLIEIDYINFINQGPSITCPAPISVNVDAGEDGAVINYTPPVGTDNAPGATTTQIGGLPSGSLFPVGTTTNTFQVEDDCGNTATCSFDVTVTDNEDPTINCPASINVNVDAGQDGAIVNYTPPVGTDNSASGTVTTNQTAGLPSGSLFPVGTTTNTFEVTDANGNTAECSFDVTVTDNEDPTINCPVSINVNVDAGQDDAIVNYTPPIGTDNASGTVTTNQTAGLPSGSLFPVGTTTNTFEVTDANGNTAECSFDVTVTDNEDPTINCPASINVNVDAGQDGAIVNYTPPVGTDNNASGIVTTTQTTGLPSGSLFPVGTTTNTFEVTDESGNTATCSFDVTVTDNEDPTINCPASINVNVDAGQDGAIVNYTPPVGTDNSASGTVTTNQTAGLPSGSLFPVGTTTNTFEVTDANGNTAECSFDVTVTDNEDPTINCPASINVNVDAGQDGAIVNYTPPIGTDNASGTVTTNQTAGLPSGSLFPVGTTTNTFEVTDANGNTAECSFDVTVTDNEDPTINCPASINVNVDAGQDGAIVNYTPPVGTDNNASGIVTTTQTTGLPSGSLFPVGTTTNTFVVTDESGNTATCSFDVTVSDDENPSIVCPGNINQNNDADICGAIVNYTTPVGTDNSEGVITEQTAGLPSGSLFPVGTTTNTFMVTDAAGNTATCSFDVTVTDNESPIITCPQDITQTADSDQCSSVLNIVNPTATDNCSTVFVFIGTRSDNLELTDPYPVGSTTITWTATDEASNVSIPCIQTINISDDETPVFAETLPEDFIVECDQVPVADVLTAIDNCDSITVTFEEERIDGSCISNYTLERTWLATDISGNTTQHTQIITVQDTTAPVLSLPANASAECSDDLSTIAFGEATATDNCDANPVITYVDATENGSCPGSLVITRTWTATDVCGNSVSVDQTISTSDTTAPVFVETLPQDFTIECNSVPEPVILTATDNCSSAKVEVNDTRTDGNCPNNYKITRVYTATDDCGNTNTHAQIITVQDITPPTFVETLPDASIVVECDAIPEAETLTATDTCGSALVSVENVRTDGDCDNNYTIARTWTATDECGLTTSHTQIITVQDTTPPTFVGTLPSDLTVECDSIPNAESLTASDNCGDATVSVNDMRTDGDCANNYVISRTWTATDACGLITRYSQTITVQDTTAPVPTTTFDGTLNVSCTDVPDAPELEFTDNCSSNVIVVFNETNSFDENVLVDYEIIRTWTVRDECNNEEVYTQTLFVALDEVITEITVADRCFDDGIINLNDFTEGLNTNGVWEILEGDIAATINNDGVFDPTGLELSEDFLPKDGGIDYKFRYTTTDNGCISITEITMNVNADCVVLPCGENDIEISKAVTPNGDLINDFFYISGIDLCGFTAGVKIFNRWGALVFESDNYPLVNAIEKNLSPPAQSWDGTVHKSSIGNAGKVPNGTYYYIITLKDSGLNPITGPVYLGTK